jgi:hypothetical protein
MQSFVSLCPLVAVTQAPDISASTVDLLASPREGIRQYILHLLGGDGENSHGLDGIISIAEGDESLGDVGDTSECSVSYPSNTIGEYSFLERLSASLDVYHWLLKSGYLSSEELQLLSYADPADSAGVEAATTAKKKRKMTSSQTDNKEGDIPRRQPLLWHRVRLFLEACESRIECSETRRSTPDDHDAHVQSEQDMRVKEMRAEVLRRSIQLIAAVVVDSIAKEKKEEGELDVTAMAVQVLGQESSEVSKRVFEFFCRQHIWQRSLFVTVSSSQFRAEI